MGSDLRLKKGIDTMTNKMTKRDYFNTLLTLSEVQSNEALVGFINHEIELLARKNTSDKKPTAQQKLNEGIKSAILDSMEANTLYTITDMIKTFPACAELSNQRVSALVRQMVADGVLTRTEEKRKAFFSLTEVSEDTED